MSERLLTVREACDRLHVSPPTLYELFNRGELDSLKIGKARRVPESAVERFIADRVASVGPDDAA